MPGSAFYEAVRDKLTLSFERAEDTAAFDNWHNWALARGRPVFVPEGMSARTLLALYWLAYLAFYGRPWKIVSLVTSGAFRWRMLADGAAVFGKGISSMVALLVRRGGHQKTGVDD